MKATFKTISERESMARLRDYIDRNAATIDDAEERREFVATWNNTIELRRQRIDNASDEPVKVSDDAYAVDTGLPRSGGPTSFAIPKPQ